MVIILSRYIVRDKRPYARPARYSSSTKYVLIVDEKKTVFGVGFFPSYRKFIERVKNKYGEDAKYEIDYSKPSVLYL